MFNLQEKAEGRAWENNFSCKSLEPGNILSQVREGPRPSSTD